MDGQNITQWDVLMKLEESQESITHLNKFCLDITCLYDSLKHSVLDYADGKEKGKDLYVHNDKLTKESADCTNIIDDVIKNLEDCRTLLNAFLEKKTIKSGDNMIEKIEGKILDLEQRGRSLDYLKSEYLLLADELMDSIILYNKDGDSEIQNDMMAEINGLINLKDELILELIEFANHIVLLDSELDKNELDTYFENKNNHILPLQNRTKLINKLNSEYILSAKRYIKYECYLENEEDIPLHHEQIKTIKGKYIESKEKLLAELKCYIGFIESIDSNLVEIN